MFSNNSCIILSQLKALLMNNNSIKNCERIDYYFFVLFTYNFMVFELCQLAQWEFNHKMVDADASRKHKDSKKKIEINICI